MNVHTVLHEAVTVLKASNNSGEEKLEAQLLLEQLLDVNHAWLITHADHEVSSDLQQQFEALIQRRITGEPIAHILGGREFYGLPFKVTPDTLIPRPDTETLVDAALAKIPPSEVTNILDLGTGSGAIALAIAKHRLNAKITAVDASEAALIVTQENLQALNIHNVALVLSNWFCALGNQYFDVIVSNPPYIEQDDAHLSQGDLRFEPLSALASGEDGLDDIRQITQAASAHLKPHGWLMFEHGYRQASSVATLLASAHFCNIETLKDLGGNDRVTLGRKL